MAPNSIICTWLAAFPKSGSTWLRFLLHHLLYGPPVVSRDVDRALPSIHDDERKWWTEALTQRSIVLTHKCVSAQLDRFAQISSFIQVVRHPADVLLSDAHFFALTQLDSRLKKLGAGTDPSAVMQDLANTYLNLVLVRGKVPKQDRLGFGTWTENVDGWMAQLEQRPSILIRYEDLKARPIEQLGRLCHFLGVERSLEQLEAVRDGASVESMKAMQEREIREQIPGRFYNPRHRQAYDMGLRFVRKGAVGQKLLLQGQAAERLKQHFGQTMEQLGYTWSEGAGAAGPLSPVLQSVRPLNS